MGNSGEDILYFGENLRRCRSRAGLTQEACAELAEISAKYMGALERGEQAPTLRVMVRLAKALNVQVAELLSLAEMATPDYEHIMNINGILKERNSEALRKLSTILSIIFDEKIKR